MGSKSSSLRRLLFTRRISIAIGKGVVARVGEADGPWDCETAESRVGNCTDELPISNAWESKDKSSLIVEADPRGKNCGGGVRYLPSSKPSQNSSPFELRAACCLKLPTAELFARLIISFAKVSSTL